MKYTKHNNNSVFTSNRSTITNHRSNSDSSSDR